MDLGSTMVLPAPVFPGFSVDFDVETTVSCVLGSGMMYGMYLENRKLRG